MRMSINELREIVRDNKKFGDLELCLKWHRRLWDFLSTVENPQCLRGDDLKFATFFNSAKVHQDLLKEFELNEEENQNNIKSQQKNETKHSRQSFLSEYSRDLTKNAKENKMISLCFTEGLSSRIKKTDSLKGKTDDICTFCDFICTSCKK